MKAAAFNYAQATSLTHALDLLEEHGEGARLVAGGQSLVPAMNLRMVSPDFLVDIGGLSELRSISQTPAGLRIGAMTRHAEILGSPLLQQHCPLLGEAMRHVAHAAIRNRGTIGGNLAHADPASEMPACMLALDATIVATNRKGVRRIAARDFFTGIYETALSPGEILSAIEIPAARKGQLTGFSELARRHGDFAIAGLACSIVLGEAGDVDEARLAFFAVGDRPLLAQAAAAALKGKPLSAETIAFSRAALGDDLDPQDDLQATGPMRLHLAGVLLERVLTSLSQGSAKA